MPFVPMMQVTTLLSILSLAIIASCVGGINIIPDSSPVWVQMPTSLNLTCESDPGAAIAWSKDGQRIAGDGFITSSQTSGSKISGTLVKKNPNVNDSGEYSCDVDQSRRTVQVNVFQIETTDDDFYLSKEATLSCNPVGIPEPDLLGFYWMKNQTNVASIDALKDRYVEYASNYSLHISDLILGDMGAYSCVFTLTEVRHSDGTQEGDYQQDVHLYSKPIISSKVDKSKNLVQGDNLQLKCSFVGHPQPTILWLKDGIEIDYETDKRITTKDNGDTVNGILSIYDLTFDDRAEYTCEATNIEGVTNSTIIVRVKDKLAALWPFLGIVAEVVVLCVIIFIYERKRSKSMDDEVDEANNVDNAQEHKGKDEVRQRNVKS